MTAAPPAATSTDYPDDDYLDDDMPEDGEDMTFDCPRFWTPEGWHCPTEDCDWECPYS